MYKQNKWQKPTSNNSGMSVVLKEAILKECIINIEGDIQYHIKNIIIHSYKESGDDLIIACEMRFTDGKVFFGNIVL